MSALVDPVLQQLRHQLSYVAGGPGASTAGPIQLGTKTQCGLIYLLLFFFFSVSTVDLELEVGVAFSQNIVNMDSYVLIQVLTGS